jgi:hypothetical protein
MKSKDSLFCNSVAIEYLCSSMKFHINWDALGVSATVACAIHCALLPLLISSLPLFGTNILENIFFDDRNLFAVAWLPASSSQLYPLVSFYFWHFFSFP